ncbi:MAG: LysM peptidoglycan-binding domain-containing protein [Bacillaceae bacterium]|nr:LysM peptidoglycan-binding domain-containing protein [Bacillaceae bacterium]
MNIQRYELQKLDKAQEEFALVVHLDDHQVEFANELGTKPQSEKNLRTIALNIVYAKYPGIKVTVVKVMVGGMLATTLPLLTNTQTVSGQTSMDSSQSTQNTSIYYQVAPGDTLWMLSRMYGTTVDNIRFVNHLKTDHLLPNQRIIIPKALHTVRSGDYLSVLARDYNTPIVAIREANSLSNDNIRIGQTLVIPIVVNGAQLAQPAQPSMQPSPTPQSSTQFSTYTVIAGDSLSVIAQRYGTSVDSLRSANQLTSDVIRVGQTLVIPTSPGQASSPKIQIIDSVYTVVAGDSLSVIAQRFGTTVNALRAANQLTSDVLQVGQRLVIPSRNTKLASPSQATVTTASATVQQGSTYTVVAGDNLSVIAQRFGTTVNALRTANQLTSDVLRIGQRLVIPGGNTNLTSPSQSTVTPVTAPTHQRSTYTVVAGDNLSVIAQRFGTTVNALRTANQLTSDVLRIGQTLTIPTNGTSTSAPAPAATATTHTVVSGDNLSSIANRYRTTVNALRSANNLRTDVLQIGQILTIPNGTSSATPSNTVHNGSTAPVTIRNINHTVRSGDNMWNISTQYGVPYNDLLRHNNMTVQSTLRIGQVIQVPQFQVPVRPVVSARHGEVLDWWTEARYVFSTGKVATITDFQTGRQFQVRHTMGGNHADSEPLTSRDAQIMREIWGGSYSWTPRAIIVEVDGRRLAAAMHSMPHGDQTIRNNNYNGHFCIHFLNSQRHSDGQVQSTMQRQIEIAAGRSIR